jgi:hypothetical protein
LHSLQEGNNLKPISVSFSLYVKVSVTLYIFSCSGNFGEGLKLEMPMSIKKQIFRPNYCLTGCLEFEPGSAEPKKHREYLKSMAKYVQSSRYVHLVAVFKICASVPTSSM